jgi:hypothetical protein
MGDGYFTDGFVKICTDNFTKEEKKKEKNIFFSFFSLDFNKNFRR